MTYEKRICGLTGKLINVPIKDSPKKLSKNRIKKNKYKAQKRAKRKAITAYQFSAILTHRSRFGCNPETKWIMAGH